MSTKDEPLSIDKVAQALEAAGFSDRNIRAVKLALLVAHGATQVVKQNVEAYGTLVRDQLLELEP
jgi:hydroxymethylpyrimidine/phosphomethylpyrimidine kinase